LSPAPETAGGFLPDPIEITDAGEPLGTELDIMGSLSSFLDASRSGLPPEIRVADNFCSRAIAFAAIRSAQSGGTRVAVDDLPHSSDVSDCIAPHNQEAG
jgi:hypothetical protein